MTEYDDALLEDDILSLPDINNSEEYESNLTDSNYNYTKSEYIQEEIKSKLAVESDNFNLKILDPYEKGFNNKDYDLQFKANNFNDDKEFSIQEEKIDENTYDNDCESMSYNKNNNSESEVESTGSILSMENKNQWLNNDLRFKLNNNKSQKTIEGTSKLENYNNLSNENEEVWNNQNNRDYIDFQYNNFERKKFLENRIQFESLTNCTAPQIMYQSGHNFQRNPESNFITYGFNSVPISAVTHFGHDKQFYSQSLITDQTYSGFNPNSYDYETQYPQIQDSPQSLNPQLLVNNILPMNQSVPRDTIFQFNQPLPMNQVLQINQNLPLHNYLQMPFMINQKEKVMFNPNMQTRDNSCTIPNYLPSFHPERLSYNNHPERLSYNNHPEHFSYNNQHHNTVIHPSDDERNLNIHKILVNRHFGRNTTEREVRMINKCIDYKGFSKNNFSRATYQKTTQEDPYSYFSDVWQKKMIQKYNNECTGGSHSSQILFSSNNNLSDNYNKSQPMEQNHNFEKLSTNNKTMTNIYSKQKDNFELQQLSKNKNTMNNMHSKQENNFELQKLSINKNSVNNMYFAGKNNNKSKKRKQKQKFFKKLLAEKCDNNNNNKKEQVPKDSKQLLEIGKELKEEDMNTEMKDYCKRIEEQKRLREIFLKRKEMRRMMLAMKNEMK